MEVDVVEVTVTVGWPGAETGSGRVSITVYWIKDQYIFIHSYRILHGCHSYCDYTR